jgi:hypothetical protein
MQRFFSSAAQSRERTEHGGLVRLRLGSAPRREGRRHSASKDARKRAYGATSGARDLGIPRFQ